ncbi:uncharacterized protein PV09_09347 [Verruconis gallopava]|uniref:Uncharacterized protein n=1 Tax=Verruconis gallopava TaxID=253628 RepID=A0A0D1YDU1_9PEZI|nr:uncharacterized protein PV09_09347 [Verruconis gallopava]KIV98901.1 hypothetical protein PV09_09347 [Verruconis gallopava]
MRTVPTKLHKELIDNPDLLLTQSDVPVLVIDGPLDLIVDSIASKAELNDEQRKIRKAGSGGTVQEVETRSEVPKPISYSFILSADRSHRPHLPYILAMNIFGAGLVLARAHGFDIGKHTENLALDACTEDQLDPCVCFCSAEQTRPDENKTHPL